MKNDPIILVVVLRSFTYFKSINRPNFNFSNVKKYKENKIIHNRHASMAKVIQAMTDFIGILKIQTSIIVLWL